MNKSTVHISLLGHYTEGALKFECKGNGTLLGDVAQVALTVAKPRVPVKLHHERRMKRAHQRFLKKNSWRPSKGDDGEPSKNDKFSFLDTSVFGTAGSSSLEQLLYDTGEEEVSEAESAAGREDGILDAEETVEDNDADFVSYDETRAQAQADDGEALQGPDDNDNSEDSTNLRFVESAFVNEDQPLGMEQEAATQSPYLGPRDEDDWAEMSQEGTMPTGRRLTGLQVASSATRRNGTGNTQGSTPESDKESAPDKARRVVREDTPAHYMASISMSHLQLAKLKWLSGFPVLSKLGVLGGRVVFATFPGDYAGEHFHAGLSMVGDLTPAPEGPLAPLKRGSPRLPIFKIDAKVPLKHHRKADFTVTGAMQGKLVFSTGEARPLALATATIEDVHMFIKKRKGTVGITFKAHL